MTDCRKKGELGRLLRKELPIPMDHREVPPRTPGETEVKFGTFQGSLMTPQIVYPSSRLGSPGFSRRHETYPRSCYVDRLSYI